MLSYLIISCLAFISLLLFVKCDQREVCIGDLLLLILMSIFWPLCFLLCIGLLLEEIEVCQKILNKKIF